MSTIQPSRPRRWSSRISNMTNNNTGGSTSSANNLTAAHQNSTPTSPYGMVSSNTRDAAGNYDGPNYGAGFPVTENRIIYEIPDIHMKPLPFYDTVHTLIRSAGLMSDGVLGRINESMVEFKLSVEYADMVAMSLNTKQILLRTCYLDNTSEQDDNFPHDVTIIVNGATIGLPNAIANPNKPNIPAKRPGIHVDISKHCKLCPYVTNTVLIKWFVDPQEPARSYVVNVSIAERVRSEILLDRIKTRGLSDPGATKRLIHDSDTEVATTNLQTSLLCPLGKMRMSMPCKSTNCQHIPCFDALFYLQMNEKKASWICPVCYKPAYFRDLMIDGYFMDILKNTSATTTEVTLNLDGSWNPVVKMELQASSENPPPEIITISDDDD